MAIERQPNTIYVLSLSYGKDSLACLEAIRQLGYPLDRIVHAEVWFDQDTPADLPPMVEFKKRADEIILQRYGIKVEHVCAHKRSQIGKVEREREREADDPSTDVPTAISSTRTTGAESETEQCTDFRTQKEGGAIALNTEDKLTYVDIFYRTIKPRKAKVTRGGVLADARTMYGFASRRANWCNGLLKAGILDRALSTASPDYRKSKGFYGVQENSRSTHYIRIPNRQRELVYKQPQKADFRTSPRTTGRK